MGFFSNRVQIAEMNIALSKDSVEGKVFVGMQNIPYAHNGTQEVFFDEEVYSAILYLYYFDRVVGNLSEVSAAGIMVNIQTLALHTLDEAMEAKNEEGWQKKKSSLKFPNTWHFCKTSDDLKGEIFKAKAKIYLDGNNVYCNTEFPLIKYIDAYVYLSVEALFVYLIQNLNYINFSLYFLSAFLSQLSYYNGKKPSIFNLGKAVLYGLKQASEARQKFVQQLQTTVQEDGDKR